MTDGGGDMPVAPEVPSFEREVSGDEEFVVGGRFKDGAIVADTEADGAGGGSSSLDAVDDR